MSCLNSLLSGARAAALVGLLLAPAAAGARESWTFVPRASLVQSYESNPLARPDDKDPIDDFVTRLAPSLSLTRDTETGNATLSLSSSARFHQELTELNTIDPAARFGVEQRLTPHFRLIGDASWSRKNATEPFNPEGVEVTTGRPDVTRWDASGGFGYAFSPVSGMQLTYRNSDTEYDGAENTVRQRNRGTSVLALLFNRTLSATEQLQASFSYQLTDFVATDPLVGVAGREPQDDTQFAGTLGYTRRFSPRTSLSLTGGIRSLHSEGNGFSNVTLQRPDGSLTNLPLDQTSTAFTGGAVLTRTGKRSNLTLSFNQQTRPASGRSSSIDVQTYSVNYRRRLSERVTLKLNASLSDQASAGENFALVDAPEIVPGVFACPQGSLLGNRDDPDGVTRPVCAFRVESAIDEQIRFLSLGLDWRVGKRFTTLFTYRYTDKDSPGLTGQGYDQHSIRVGFRYSFDIDVP